MRIRGFGRVGTRRAASTNTGTAPSAPAQPPITTAPTPSGNANRYEFVLDQSTVSPGDLVTATIFPNASHVGGAVTARIGTASVTVNLPSSGTAPVAVSMLAPASAGEYLMTLSNTAGLIDPAPCPFTVFTPSAGKARTLAASFIRFDQAIHQQNSIVGTPRGFTAAKWGRGAGKVSLAVSSLSGDTDGLWMRPYSAFSSGATQSTGTGTALDGAVQVYGPITAGKTIRVMLPAGPRFTYWDIATDAAMTNPVRIRQRIGVGHVIAELTRSIGHTMVGSYAYGSNQVPLGTDYPDTASWVSFDPNNGGYTDIEPNHYTTGVVQWYRHDGASAMPWSGNYGEGSSSGAQERARIIAAYRGVITGVVGLVPNGAALDALVAHDGTPRDALRNTLAIACDTEFREFHFEGVTNGADEWHDTTYPYSTAETLARYKGLVGWITRNVPSCGVLTLHTGNSGVFGSDGSAPAGYVRLYDMMQRQIAAVDPRVCVRHDSVWNARYGGHPTMNARISMAQSIVQQYQMTENVGWGGQQVPYDKRGPTLARSGTYNATTGIVRIPFHLNGAASLKASRLDFSNAPGIGYRDASASEAASVVSIFAGAGYASNGRPIRTEGASINTVSPPSGYDGTIDILLSGRGTGSVTYDDGSTGPLPSTMNAHFAADFGASNASVLPSFDSRTHGDAQPAVFFADNQNDPANGLYIGREMQPAVDINIMAA